MLDPYYNYIKALHLIFVITWFAGLFYIPRLFIYHIEAYQKEVRARDSGRTNEIDGEAFVVYHYLAFGNFSHFFCFAFTLHIPSWLLQDWMLIKLFSWHFCFCIITKPTVFSWLSNKTKSGILPFSCAFE